MLPAIGWSRGGTSQNVIARFVSPFVAPLARGETGGLAILANEIRRCMLWSEISGRAITHLHLRADKKTIERNRLAAVARVTTPQNCLSPTEGWR
jgi:hypothetical protein